MDAEFDAKQAAMLGLLQLRCPMPRPDGSSCDGVMKADWFTSLDRQQRLRCSNFSREHRSYWTPGGRITVQVDDD